MSYCRWSSNNWKCDLYCFEDVNGGITTMVAASKIIGEVPEVPIKILLDGKKDEWFELYRKQMDFLKIAPREPIDLKYDGEIFNDPDHESFLARLLHLRETGYNFPDYVLEMVKEDMKNE